MRPVTLTIEGLRSFRALVEISFAGREHLAIIGDTGAGKSSILEAMTYALFGRTSFTGHANQEIMNDLADYMRVTLRFAVAGRTFGVTRTLRRGSDRTVGAARASLTEFGPDGREIRKIEQVRLVNKAIQDVVGLDAEAFLRTVVLPQGQFARLLVGDDPTERAGILRQVWRTDELAQAGRLADEALPELGELAGKVTQALDGTPEDPATHLRQLRADAGLRADAARHARETHHAAFQARGTLVTAEETIRAAESVLARIHSFDFATATSAAEQIVRNVVAIVAQREAAEERQRGLWEQLRAIPTDGDGLDHQAVGVARTILDGLPSQASSIVDTAIRARAEAAEVDDVRRLTDELAGLVQDLARQIDQRADERQRLEAVVTDTGTNLGEARTLLQDVQRAATEAAKLREQARGTADQAALLAGEMTRLRDRDLADAGQRATAAEAAYAAAQRHDAAAAAAHDLHVGDVCTVCNRTLPADWQRPVTEDLDAARANSQAAQEVLAEVRNKINELETRAEITSAQAAKLQEDAENSWGIARASSGCLTSLIGRAEVDVSALPPDDELLLPLVSAAATAAEQLTAFDEESQRLREQRATAQTNLGNARANLTRILTASSQSSAQLADAIGTLRSVLASLPGQLRIDAAMPDDPLGIEVIQLDGLDAAHQALEQRAQELDDRAERRGQLQQKLDRGAEDLRDLDSRWAAEVVSPGNDLAVTVNGHRDELAKGIALLSIGDVPLQPAISLSDPAKLADMTDTLHATTDEVTRRVHALANTARDDTGTAREIIAQVASELDVAAALATDAPDPDQVVARTDDNATEAEFRSHAAEQAAEDFARLVDPLTRLRRVGEELSFTYNAVKDLSAALKPGAFPKWLTLRRSRALLIHASRLLEQMTSDRYAFAEFSDEYAEWRIVDKDSGLARTPASLSGGEQFIASLALALGMVEMMARSGGRLESLWLDEGFGSLDRSNLDAAIEALASVAARGRMVAVISHVRAVADQVSDVLAVTRRATGTQARWLDQHQRAQLATSDLDSETASALSGLLE